MRQSFPRLPVVGYGGEGLAHPLLQRVELLLRLHGERHGGRRVVARLELDEPPVRLPVRHLAVGRQGGRAAPHELGHRVAGAGQGAEDLEGGGAGRQFDWKNG